MTTRHVKTAEPTSETSCSGLSVCVDPTECLM